MDISLFTSPFFRDSCCLYPFLNSSRSCLGCKKTHGFVQCYTEWDHPRKKKRKIVIWIWHSLTRAVTYLSSDGLGFLDKIFFFFNIFNICVCVFCGECGCICMISFCVDESAVITLNEGYEWLYGPYLYHYHLYYPARQCVITDISTAICVNVWPY